MRKLWLCLIVFYCILPGSAKAQLIEESPEVSGKIAVPFLLLSSDAVSSGMGEAGNALLSSFSNADPNTAKANFLEGKFALNLTYTPWLRQLVSDRKLMFVGGFYKIAPRMTLTGSLNYLSYGQIDLTDMNRTNLGTIQPNEYVASLGISKGFGSNFSLGMKLKLVHSNLYSGAGTSVLRQTGTAYCVDLSSYHVFPVNPTSNSQIEVSFNLENIGPKISYYNQSDQKSFLPANLKIGTAFKTITSSDSELGFAVDLNKLLVPLNDLNKDAGVLESMVSSFGSGSGIADLGVSVGTEYTFRKKLAFRLGYNFQGDRRSLGSYFSFGMGVKHKSVGLNMAYIAGNPQRTFLSNTIRFTLGYSI